jgi:hypothetical protein
MRHPSQGQLLDYIAGLSGAEPAERLVAHLAECTPCHERAKALQLLRADFEGSWSRFLAEIAQRSARPEREAVREIVFQGLLDGARRLATAALGPLPAPVTLRAAFVPVYRGVGDAERRPEAGRWAAEASALLARGRPEEALGRLAQVAASDPHVAASARLDLLAADALTARVVVDAARRAVSVIVYPEAAVRNAAAVLDRPSTGGEPPRRRPLEAVEGAPYWLAEFEEVPDGPFTLRLEMEGGSPS